MVGKNSKAEMMSNDTKKFSLTQLQSEIRKIVSDNFTVDIWVIAEVSEVKINFSGHAYLELVEKSEVSDDIISRARAIIWSRQARMLLPYFETTTGSAIGEGMKILIKVSVEYHELYGLSLIINDIDPSYTIGEIAVKRKKIIKRLEKEGVIGMNQECEYPLLPKSIAIISSPKAAGYQDFITHLLNNQYGYTYRTNLYEAIMQGEDTAISVTSALDEIYKGIDNTDLVVIVRGGGSQADLSWFDNYGIAYMVTQFPVPVLTGIGHEKDLSVTDLVAFNNFKTPTAVADYIIESTRATEEYIISTGKRIKDLSMLVMSSNRDLFKNTRIRIIPLINNELSKNREDLSILRHKIRGATSLYIERNMTLTEIVRNSFTREAGLCIRKRLESLTYIEGELRKQSVSAVTKNKEKLEYVNRSFQNLSPERVLRRGYSITLLNGRSVRQAAKLNKGDNITTILHEGKIDSKIFEIKE